MKQQYFKSDSGNLKEFAGKLGSPDLIVMISEKDLFRTHVSELEAMYPGVPSIGTTGHFYGKTLKEGGVALTAFYGAKVKAGVLRSVSTMPVRDIGTLQSHVREIAPGANDTACIDLCTGNDAAVLTTMYSILGKNHICLTGGTAFDGMVSCCGQVYEDADAYALLKNTSGKIRSYKENIYRPREDLRLIASKTDRANYYVGELNGIPAKKLYMDTLGISESEIATQTFKNPFGKITGRDVCIISLKEVKGSGLCCYRQVNDSDVLTILDLQDIPSIVDETLRSISRDFSRIGGIFSVNCAFRYLLFTQEGFMSSYLKQMSGLDCHCGFVGNGEHSDAQFVNQSMSCIVFD